MPLDAQLEAILFYKTEPLAYSALMEMLALSGAEGEARLREAIAALEGRLAHGGLRLVVQGDMIALGTAPEVAPVIEGIRKLELSKDLGKAALETLTIILYKHPVSKGEIDYVRGVNSGFILRSLLVRGLIERLPNPKDKRTFLYAPSVDTLSYLGITRVQELPEYETMMAHVAAFEKDFTEGEEGE